MESGLQGETLTIVIVMANIDLIHTIENCDSQELVIVDLGICF